DRPPEAGPSSFGQHPLPPEPDVEPVALVARSSPSPQRRELAHQSGLEELPDLGAEGRVVRSVAQVHVPGSVPKATDPAPRNSSVLPAVVREQESATCCSRVRRPPGTPR